MVKRPGDLKSDSLGDILLAKYDRLNESSKNRMHFRLFVAICSIPVGYLVSAYSGVYFGYLIYSGLAALIALVSASWILFQPPPISEIPPGISLPSSTPVKVKPKRTQSLTPSSKPSTPNPSTPYSPSSPRDILSVISAAKQKSDRKPSPMLPDHRPMLPLGEFKPALKPVMVKIAPVLDGFSIQDAPPNASVWAEEMKQWVLFKILNPLVASMEAMDNQLKQLGMLNALCESPLSPQSQVPPHLQRERLRIEAYLSGCEPRAYYISRLKNLQKASLCQYDYSSQPIPDVQIILNCFAAFFEELVPNFRQKYICAVNEKQISTMPYPRIRLLKQTTVQCVESNVIYDCGKGRDQLWMALCIWTRLIIQAGGYVGNLNISGCGIELDTVVSH